MVAELEVISGGGIQILHVMYWSLKSGVAKLPIHNAVQLLTITALL